MRNYFLLFICLIIGTNISAQEAEVVTDTTIYEVVEESPRFPACERLDTTLAAKKECAEQQLLSFMYQNVTYPFEARRDNISGTVVLSFVVEPNGYLTQGKILKDIGGGCGLEALRVAGAMNAAGVRWVPGKIKGKPVRSIYILPLKFKLKDPLDFEIVEGDSIWQVFDKYLDFNGGTEALQTFLSDKLEYPAVGNDSCLIGTIDVKTLVRSNGEVAVLNLTDYNNLGNDFWFTAIAATTSTLGNWNIAEHKGRKVPATFNLSMSFTPDAEHCQETINDYSRAITLINEATPLLEGEEVDIEKAIEMMNQALEMFPKDGAMLIARGQAFLELNRFEEACIDLSKAKLISGINWFDSILPMICK